MPKYIIDTDEMAKWLSSEPQESRAEAALAMLRELHLGTSIPTFTKPEKVALRACPKAYSDYFNEFWEAYPRKTGKGAAWKAFWAASAYAGTQQILLALCLEAIAWQMKSDEHLDRDGQYIPHAQTWLNQRRWEDENPKADTGNEDDYYIDMNGVRRRIT